MTTHQATPAEEDNTSSPKPASLKQAAGRIKGTLLWATMFGTGLSAYFIYLAVSSFVAGPLLQGLFHAALAIFIIAAPPSAILFTERKN